MVMTSKKISRVGNNDPHEVSFVQVWKINGMQKCEMVGTPY